MAMAKLTTKGQLTIPIEVRKSLRLRAGDKVEIVLTENREAIMRPVSKTVDDLFRSLHRSNAKQVSLEEMDRAIKNRMHDKFK